MQTLLAGHLPKRFVQTWCDHLVISKPINQYSDKELKNIAEGLHNWKIIPKGERRVLRCGGDRGWGETDELSSKTMEAKKVPGPIL